MRLLLVHADHFEFETVTAAGAGSAGTDARTAGTDARTAETDTGTAGDRADAAETESIPGTEGVPTAGRMDDCVTAFVSVERGDGTDLDAAVANAAAEVRGLADRLDARKLALYPFEHLSDDLASAEVAATALRKLETDLDADLETDFEVLRAPVGWYAAFELSSKGHPLAERSLRVGPERGPERGDEGATDCTPSERKIAFPDGEVADARSAAGTGRLDDELGAFVEVELGDEPSGKRPPHEIVERLRERGLADEADRDGADELAWFPRGKLVRDSLVEYVTDLATEYGAMPVETTGTGGRRATRAADQHRTAPGAGRPEQFPLVADGTVSERDLPLRLYEVASRSSPDDRRAFTTPEIRTAARDAEQAREEFRAQAQLCLRTADELGLTSVAAIRTTRDFYDENEAWIGSLVADLGGPALLELVSEDRRDWSIRVDFAVVDDVGRPITNPRVELTREPVGGVDSGAGASGGDDAGSANDADGANDANDAGGANEETRHPRTLRWAPVGSIERALAALLEPPAGRDVPRLPTWLSPTQVRFIPVGDEHVESCEPLADDLDAAGVRVDVDDREKTVGERVARAEADLVPYYAVVGDREVDGGVGERDGGAGERDGLAVTVRAEEAERELDLAALRTTVLADVGDRPTKRRYLPRRVSDRLDFAGQ